MVGTVLEIVRELDDNDLLIQEKIDIITEFYKRL